MRRQRTRWLSRAITLFLSFNLPDRAQKSGRGNGAFVERAQPQQQGYPAERRASLPAPGMSGAEGKPGEQNGERHSGQGTARTRPNAQKLTPIAMMFDGDEQAGGAERPGPHFQVPGIQNSAAQRARAPGAQQ